MKIMDLPDFIKLSFIELKNGHVYCEGNQIEKSFYDELKNKYEFSISAELTGGPIFTRKKIFGAVEEGILTEIGNDMNVSHLEVDMNIPIKDYFEIHRDLQSKIIPKLPS